MNTMLMVVLDDIKSNSLSESSLVLKQQYYAHKLEKISDFASLPQQADKISEFYLKLGNLLDELVITLDLDEKMSQGL